MKFRWMIRTALSLLAVTTPFSNLAHAALGDRVPALTDAQSEIPPGAQTAKVFKKQKVTESGRTVNWTVRETHLNGNTIREYIGPDGLIFAVSWQGIKRPDLSALLGNYYQEFSKTEKSQGRNKGQRSQSLNSKRLVAHRSGHMRDIRGQVYLKDSLPEGITDRDIE